jgi:hypothetical protein
VLAGYAFVSIPSGFLIYIVLNAIVNPMSGMKK